MTLTIHVTMGLGEAMQNLGCLVLALLLLPIFLIIVGPLLVLTAVRGRQPVGPLMLNSLQYGPAGRIGAFMLGLGLWLLIWGGLVWVVVNGLVSGSTTTVTVATPTLAPLLIVEQPASGAAVTQTNQPDIVSAPTPTGTLPPTRTPTVLVIIDPTSTPNFEATPPVTNTLFAETPLPAGTVSTSTTVLTDTVILAGTPAPTVIFIATPAADGSTPAVEPTPVPTVTMLPADTQAVIGVVEDGNALLREAILLANEENLGNLAKAWQGRALEKASRFAIDLYDRYAQPLDVEFKYLSVPAIQRSTPDEVTVVSQELWTYGGRTDIEQESFEFIYVLNRKDGTWVITYYNFLNLPIPGASATPGPTTTAP